MRKQLFYVFVIIFALLGLCAQACAAKYYFDIKAGASYPKKFAPDFEGKVKHSLQFNVAAGKYLNDRTSLGLSVSYNPAFKEHSDTIGKSGKSFGRPLTHDDKICSWSVLLDAYYYFNNRANKFTPYIGIGAGIAQNIIGERIITRDQKYFKTVHRSPTTNFAWSAAAGLLIKTSETFNLSFEYRYADQGLLKTASSSTLASGRVLHPPISKTKFRTHSFLIGIRYNF